MLEILKKINESGLSPNQYFLLYALKASLRVDNIDLETEMLALKEGGYLEEDNQFLSMELNEQAFQHKATQLSQYFPPMILPTGLPARGKKSQVVSKLKVFVSTYPYDWDTIFSATQKYVARYRLQKFLYMQNASNFILDKNGDSTLALECDTLDYSEDTGISI